MNKSEADKIAKETLFQMFDMEIVSKLRTLEQHRDYMVGILSKALVDASKVTECAEFETFDEFWKCNEMHEDNMPSLSIYEFKDCLKEAYSAGQKSKALKLPDWLMYHACITGDCDCEIQQDCNAKIFSDIDDAVKSLNEGK